MRRLPKLIVTGLLFLWIDWAGLLMAQPGPPELVVQRADSGPCKHAAFSHNSQLLATDNGDEVLVWEVGSGKLLNTMKAYRSPFKEVHNTGGYSVGAARADGTIVFSPDDKIVAVLPVDFASPLNFGLTGTPPSLWNVDTGLPLTTGEWIFVGGIARNSAAPSTPEVETWTISSNRARVMELLEKGMRLQALSYDGRIGATRNEVPRKGQRVQLIDLKTGQALRTLDAVFDDILGMAFSPDGRYFAAHSSNRRFVTVWNTASGVEVTEIKQDVQYPSVGRIAFSPDGRQFAVEQGSEIVLYETASWKRTGSFHPQEGNSTRELVFSPDSKELAINSDTVSLIDALTGKLMGTMCSSPLQAVAAVEWNEKSGVFALASHDFVRIWAPVSGATPRTLKGDGTIRAIALSDDDRIALGTRYEQRDAKGHIYYFGMTKLRQPGPPDREIELGPSPRSSLFGGSSVSVDFAPDGKSVAVAMLDELCTGKSREPACYSPDEIPSVGLLTVWDTKTGDLLRKRRQPDPQLNVVRISPDALHIASGHQDHVVKIYDTASLNRSLAFKDPLDETQRPGISDFGASALAYSPDGKFLLAGSRDGLVWLLDTAGVNAPRILRAPEDFDSQKPNGAFSRPIVGVVFSHDGGRAYAVESNGRVWQWNATNWTDAGHYQIQKGGSAAALSPNSKVIAVAHQDGAIRFYAAESGKLELVLASTEDGNSSLVVSPDGRYDFGIAGDSTLASYRAGRKAIAIDSLPGNRRVPGLFNEFLKENFQSK
jgi:WD40 repeat protein